MHVTFYPLYLWHRIQNVWQHNTVYCWYHTRHMCDIICTTDDSTSTLSHQTTVFMISHALQAWHHTHCIRYRTYCIFVIKTYPLISCPILYDIISTLYDIIPNIYVTLCALYITSFQFIMSSHYCVMISQPLYMKPHPVCRAKYTLYIWHHSH